jgi:tRNA modification GTPase
MAGADAVLWIQDATEAEPERIHEPLRDGVPVTIVRNKIDLSGDRPGFVEGEPAVVMLSARTGEGLAALRQRIRELAGFRDLGEGAFTARRRHVEALRDAQQRFEAGRAALRDAHAGELLAEELRLAQQALGTITGEFTADDLLGRIFSEFCIGK